MGLLRSVVAALALGHEDSRDRGAAALGQVLGQPARDAAADALCGRGGDGALSGAAAEEAEREGDTEEARRRWAKQGAERAAKGLFSLFRSTWRRAQTTTGIKRKGNQSALLSDGASFVEPPKAGDSEGGLPPSAGSPPAPSAATPPAGGAAGAHYSADPVEEERAALRAWAAGTWPCRATASILTLRRIWWLT